MRCSEHVESDEAASPDRLGLSQPLGLVATTSVRKANVTTCELSPAAACVYTVVVHHFNWLSRHQSRAVTLSGQSLHSEPESRLFNLGWVKYTVTVAGMGV
eukprot:364930-Chlamydomonas_euryale.AAC.13